MSDPILIVMRPTRVQRPDGRVITLLPGAKSLRVSETIRTLLPKDKVAHLKAKGRLVEEAPPDGW